MTTTKRHHQQHHTTSNTTQAAGGGVARETRPMSPIRAYLERRGDPGVPGGVPSRRTHAFGEEERS